MENTDLVLIQLSMVVVVGIAAQWLAWRVRLPAIVLLLAAGIVMGPVMGFLNPDEILGDAVLPIVSMSVAIILFEGGMSLKISELRGTGRVVTMLVTLGASLTWLLSGALAVWLLGLDMRTGILLGAILMVTGPTVIGPLLRHVRPIGKSGTILKWEGLTIDPIGAIAAVLTFEFLFADSMANQASDAFVALFATFGVGVLVGLLGAGVAVLLLKKFWIPDFLINPASVAFVLLAYVGSNQAQPESGLVAVTVMGFALANQKWVRVGHILEFKENLRVLLISSLFVLLAARLSPSILGDLHWQHALFVVGLIVVVRPASVMLSTLGSNLTMQERAFICCMAPRGIVAAAIASIFALRLGGPEGDLIMTTTFLVVISSVVVYGFAALPVARRLGLAQPEPTGLLIAGASAFSRDLAAAMTTLGMRVKLVDTNVDKVQLARARGLDAHTVNYLDDDEREEFDISGIGRLLAMTPNDHANELLAHKGMEDFGRARVFRLSAGASPSSDGARTHSHGGRVLFDDRFTYEDLHDRLRSGWTIQVEAVDESNEQHWKTKAETVTPLMVVDADGGAKLVESGRRPVPKAGQKIVFFAPKAN